MTLGKKIRELRLERDWTQGKLAKKSGVDRGALASIETGKAKNPTTVNLLKLARAFNIRPEELYQAAGYIKERPMISIQTPSELLERIRLILPDSVPIYEAFTPHAGRLLEAIDYIPVARDQAKGKNLEGYIVHGKCLEPDINDGDIIIIERGRQIHNRDMIACIVDGEAMLARIRKISNKIYLENNNGRIKLDEALVAAPIVEVRRRLK